MEDRAWQTSFQVMDICNCHLNPEIFLVTCRWLTCCVMQLGPQRKSLYGWRLETLCLHRVLQSHGKGSMAAFMAKCKRDRWMIMICVVIIVISYIRAISGDKIRQWLKGSVRILQCDLWLHEAWSTISRWKCQSDPAPSLPQSDFS